MRVASRAAVVAWPSSRALVVLSIWLSGAATVTAQAPLRLKGRTFIPPANVHAGVDFARPRSVAATPQHVLIQFAGPITPDDRAAVEAAGATVLRYVPENALAVSTSVAFDASAIPGARWIGALEPADRVSADTAADLSRTAPRYRFTAVEFQPDVDRAEADRRLSIAHASRVAAPRLPGYLALIDTDPRVIDALSADQAVAWIYPASDGAIEAGTLACEGIVAPEGVVANYATVGDGWDGPGAAHTELSWFLEHPSGDLPAGVQSQEIARAEAEWSQYIDVAWRMAAGAGEDRSVTILWGPTDHGDGYPFAPEVLAHTFYPAPIAPESIAGDMHFNENYLWGAGDGSRYDVFSVALHELGHALGLDHSSNPDSVMYPMYRGIVRGLADDDIQAARSLYPPAPEPTIPAGWTSASIGADMPGGATESGGFYTIDAAGRDVWGTTDECRFVWTPLPGDGDIVARVDSLQAVHRWTKAGVMIRASAAPGSPQAFMFVSGSRGLAFQRRREDGGLSVSTDGIEGSAPRWVWLSRRGSVVTAYAAEDGGAWTLIGSDAIALGATALAGLAVTSHDLAAVATAVFSHVTVTPAPGWTSTDIGPVGRAGSWAASGTGGAVTGAGDDIWDTADAFQFVWTRLSGDGEILARVASIDYVRAWSKAGVMIRANLSPASPHAFMLVSAGKGYAFQRRPEQGGLSQHTSGGTGGAPEWVRLVRSGDTITAYHSTDGAAWTQVGSDTILMPQDTYVGLAVSSHTASATCRAVFDHVIVR